MPIGNEDKNKNRGRCPAVFCGAAMARTACLPNCGDMFGWILPEVVVSDNRGALRGSCDGGDAFLGGVLACVAVVGRRDDVVV